LETFGLTKRFASKAAGVYTSQNLATLLLTEGFATVIRSVVRDSDFNAEYTAAEEVAKKLHKNVELQFSLV
jgi:endonuclease YncB( thermonuclease family)